MEVNLLVVTFILASALHFTIQKLFIYNKRFDNFNHRSSHKTLATRSGGIGIFLTVFIISIYYYLQGIELFDYSLFIPLGIMFIIGVYDDLYNADFKLKFILQIIVAKILIDQGFVISNYFGLFGLYEVPWIVAQVTTIFVFLVVVNAINFIDGIDALAITEVIKIILIIECFSFEQNNITPLGVITITSVIPLYYFNLKKKRKVFLGDGGSMLLGALCMIYVLEVLGENFIFVKKFLINKTLFVILVLIYPLLDLLRVFILRIRMGKSPFSADKNHIHHILSSKYRINSINTLLIINLVSITIFVLTIIIYNKIFQ